MTTRQGGRVGVCEVLHLERPQAFRDQRVALWGWACGNGEQRVLRHVHVGEQQVVLEQDADAPRFGWQRVEMAPLQRHAAFEAQPRIECAADRRQQAGLAGAARTHHRVNLPWSNHDPQIAD